MSNAPQSDNIDTLEEDISTRLGFYENSHPNLVTLWKEYIRAKRVNYIKSMVDCDAVIRKMSINRDISTDTIALLYALLD
jgi:hypothetical protein